MAAPLVLTRRDFAAETGARAAPALALSPDAALVVMADGNTFLVDMAGDFHGLPPQAADMLRRALAVGEAQTAAEIAARHGVPVARVAADLDAFLAGLVAKGALVRNGAVRRPNPFKRAGAALFARCLGLVFALRRSMKARARAALTVSRLSFVFFGWRATLDAWRRALPAATAAPAHPAETANAIDETVRAAGTRHWLGIDCKERGIAAWALGRALGLAPRLNIGVVPYPLGGHCWCTVDGRVVADDPAYAAKFTPVLGYA